jgi:phytoene/squalene synthetase
MSSTEKLAALTSLETAIVTIAKKQSTQSHPVIQEDYCINAFCSDEATSSITEHSEIANMLVALSDTIYKYDLQTTAFLDLLAAFKQDATQNRYYDFGEVLNYCCHSANPIGRLILQLAKQDTIENLEYSDYICTSLQLINFIQDLHHDLIKLDRCYIPLKELSKFQVSIEELKNFRYSTNISVLIKHQLDRINTIFNKGLPLSSQLQGLFGFEIKLILAGGGQILHKLTTRKDYYQRPILSFKDKVQMLWSSLFTNSFVTITEPVMTDK